MFILYVVGAIVVVVILLFSSLISSYKKVPPNEALIVYGLGGKRIVQGGGLFVIPGLQNSKTISMMLMSFDVVPQQSMFSKQGIALSIEAVAQIKIKSDPTAILTASEQFLDRPDNERQNIILHSIEGHLRGIVGQLEVSQILKNPEEINSKMRETCSEDLDKMGLEVVSFTIKQVMDKLGYIENLGVPEIEKVKKEAAISRAENERDVAINKSEADKSAAIAQANAHQLRIEAESASKTKEAEYQMGLDIKQAEYKQEVETKRAHADLAYELQQNKLQQTLITEKVRINQMESEATSKVRQIEIELKQKELEATVIKPAEADKQRVMLRAEAEKAQTILQAEAQAESTIKRGQADAAAELAKGKAQAEVIQLAGFAEAAALEKKAEAYKQYTQAAIVVEMLRILPELAERIAQPLSNVDKITVISQDGATSGINKITADITKIMSQVPEITQTLTGYPLMDIIKNVLHGTDKADMQVPPAVSVPYLNKDEV
ncbi:flotillin family protein [Paenibacillus psychroresistens]|uniref:Flotillin family protein n=1 Tax=Paenibacillus psychroresistens TaxID=1778678 RepID=A0A6B8RLP9_9BACL|nr:SPFH domain-containing protein [Paenibacillus psychroresistens]QGQ96684.1 flotillin family protein [Paenibacillus psychroresistens]